MSRRLIDQQAAIDIAKELTITVEGYEMHNQAVMNYCAEIMQLPSVQPKHGKWEPYSQFYPEVNTHWVKWECSECGYGRTKGWEGTTDGRCPTAKICENCGAIMERDKQDE